MSTSREDIIIWQKWADPFGEENEHTDLINNYDDDNDHIMAENDGHDIGALPISQGKPIKVIATPMGIIPMNDDTASGKIFNFWLGHTNFNITSEIAKMIEMCDGVECLNIFTRYRFRIAIGKAFTDSVVMKDIQDTIYNYLENIYDDKK